MGVCWGPSSPLSAFTAHCLLLVCWVPLFPIVSFHCSLFTTCMLGSPPPHCQLSLLIVYYLYAWAPLPHCQLSLLIVYYLYAGGPSSPLSAFTAHCLLLVCWGPHLPHCHLAL